MLFYDIRLLNPYHDFTFNNKDYQEIFYGITKEWHQTLYNITFLLTDSGFTHLMNYRVLSVYIAGCSDTVENSISINRCNFENTNSAYQANALVEMHLLPCYSESMSRRNRITFQNCSFY